MLMSQDESARAIFLRNLVVGDKVRVPHLKGTGAIIGLNNRVHVLMENGPYWELIVVLKWEQVWPI